ncbi:MAG: hypothetical protein WCP32_11870 [Bacteroidota bacterium]
METNDKIIAEINMFCDPHSLLVIDVHGKLHRIYCPFKVIVIRNVYFLKTNEVVEVAAVKVSSDLILLYVIQKMAFPYSNFMILHP